MKDTRENGMQISLQLVSYTLFYNYANYFFFSHRPECDCKPTQSVDHEFTGKTSLPTTQHIGTGDKKIPSEQNVVSLGTSRKI